MATESMPLEEAIIRSIVSPTPGFINGQMFVDGSWRPIANRALIEVENPATEEIIGTVPEATAEDACDAVEAANAAWPQWSAMPPIQRAGLMHQLAKAVEKNTDSLAGLVTREQGKPLEQAKGEIAATAMFLTYAAENARCIEAVALKVPSFEEANQLANDTQFGLSAYLFTNDYKRLSKAPYILKFGELYLIWSIGEGVQGLHTGWRLSGLGGEDGKYGFDGHLRKQTSYMSWA